MLNNNKKQSKGQIFTLDILAAILGITIMLGVTVQYQTTIRDQTSEINYKEMNTLANDASQIAVKRKINQEGIANVVGNSNLEGFLDDFTGEKYGYEVHGAIGLNQGACSGKEQANSKRIVNNEGNPEALTITICSN